MESTLGAVDFRQSVEAVYRADADRLWRALLAWSGDADIASDAVAEAYAQLIRRGGDVRDPLAWTWRASFRIAAGILKARSLDELRRAPEHSLDTKAAVVSSDRTADPGLLAALQQLPPGQRAAVVLFYYADLPIRSIADRLGSNGLAVRANLSRGRRRLREILGDHDE